MPASHRSNRPQVLPNAGTTLPRAGGATLPPAPSVDLGSNQVFADAAQAVFQTMLGATMQVSDYQAATQITGRGLAVLIALNGANAGTLVICISQKAACQFVATLTGLDVGDISESVMVDGVCELVNMVAGAAKASLDDTPMRFEMTLPVSCVSDQVCINVKSGMPGGVLHCGWADQTFQLGIWRVKAS